MAEVMAEIGWTTRLCDLTEAQARSLVEVAVGGFFEVSQQRATRERGAVLMDAVIRLQSPGEAARFRATRSTA